MARVRFRAQLACDAQTGLPRLDLAGLTGIIVLAGTETPTSITDNDGLPLTDSLITISSNGFTPTFYVEDGLTQVDWWADPIRMPIDSTAGLEESAEIAADAALAAQSAAEAAAATAVIPSGGSDGDVLTRLGSATTWSSPGAVPSIEWDNVQSKPPLAAAAHTHTAANISDSTNIGRALMQAADQASGRSAIAAAPATTVSFPGLSTTDPTKASPGGHAHAASTVTFNPTGTSLTATNMQDAVVQAAATGGSGGGTGETMKFAWHSGAWVPAIPSTQPSGIRFFEFSGPSAPTGLPAYCGLGASQVLVSYDVAATV